VWGMCNESRWVWVCEVGEVFVVGRVCVVGKVCVEGRVCVVGRVCVGVYHAHV